MADIFRWKLLASVAYGGHSAKELDLILGMPSYGTSVKLLWYWRKKPKYFFFLLFWILLGVVCYCRTIGFGEFLWWWWWWWGHEH